MSATTEMIMEEIAQISQKLDELRSSGSTDPILEKKMAELSMKLRLSHSALSEGKRLLKG
jgi:hypothetical protein